VRGDAFCERSESIGVDLLHAQHQFAQSDAENLVSVCPERDEDSSLVIREQRDVIPQLAH